MEPENKDIGPIVFMDEKKPEAPALIDPVSEGQDPSTLPAVRTFSSDMAEAMREHQGSMVKIAIAEDEKRRKDREIDSPKTPRNMKLIAGGFAALLIAGGVIGAVVWYKAKQIAAVLPVSIATPNSIIRTEQFGTLDITNLSREQILSAVQNATTDPNSALGTIKNLFITKTDTNTAAATRVPAADFLTSLKTHAPADFTRALQKDFVLGVYLYDHTTTFLILQGSAHDYMQIGMLNWEPNLVNDLGPLFGTTPAGDTAGLSTAPFSDIILKNQNVRAVLNKDGTPALFYSFLDQDTIIIAKDPNTLTESIRRFGK